VHIHERKRGRVENLRPFFLRVFSNVVRSLLRGPHHSKYEAMVSDRVLEARGGLARVGSAEQAESWILAREALERLDQRKQELLILDALGYSAQEIARTFAMSEGNVYTTLHRAREEAKQLLKTHRPGSFDKT
jgi:RNA polymerase sigma factor (sigma-70 family)